MIDPDEFAYHSTFHDLIKTSQNRYFENSRLSEIRSFGNWFPEIRLIEPIFIKCLNNAIFGVVLLCLVCDCKLILTAPSKGNYPSSVFIQLSSRSVHAFRFWTEIKQSNVLSTFDARLLRTTSQKMPISAIELYRIVVRFWVFTISSLIFDSCGWNGALFVWSVNLVNEG